MATSGTNNFNLDTEQIISHALEIAEIKEPSGQDLKRAREGLNLVLIDMQNENQPLAELTNRSFTVTSADPSYELSADVLDVVSVVVTRSSASTPLERMGLIEYHKLPNKNQEGRPSQFSTDRDRTNVNLYLYPAPENATDVIDYWCLTAIEDVGSYTNTVDVHKKYLPTLIFGLAYYISLKTPGFDINKRQELKREYMEKLGKAALEDRERTSYQVTPFGYNKRR